MNNIKNEICAVILTGGLSSRMGGGIKTLTKFNNKIIFDRIFNNLKNQVRIIVINSNDSENLFYKYHVDIIKDSYKGFLGPLAGIHATLEWLKNNTKLKWLITVPSDTPFLPKDLAQKLFIKASNNNCKIVMAKSNNKIHPVIGIWHISVLKSLDDGLNSGMRKIMDWANKHPLDFEDFSNSKYDPFFNINYYQDIEEAEKIENRYF